MKFLAIRVLFAIIIKKYLMSKFEKVIAGFVGFATAVTMSFGTASAATTEELQAQIASLLATIQGLQAQLGTATTGTATTAGYTFTKDLTVGSKGTDVTNLQNMLGVSPSTGYFGSITKAALIKYQSEKGISPAAGYFGPKTRAFANTASAGTTTSGTTTTTPVVIGSGTTLAAALSYDNPAAGTLIAGQAVGDLAHFTFSNPTGVEQKVTKLVFNRTGISNDASLVNVYLFDGAKRVTDSATVSLTKITFNDASGIFTIPAGGMKTIAVKADILSSATGQIIGVSLASAEGSVAVSGTYPILGNNHSIATATMATVDFAAVSAATPTIDPQNEYVMWQSSVTFNTRAVNLKSMIFRMIGSVTTSDLGNFKLFIDGTQVGSTVATLDSNGYVTFDLSAAPKTIETGTRTIKLVGDIIGGSTKTFGFSLQNAGDAVFVDSQVGQPVLPTVASATFSALTMGTATINGGTLTITKKADSPSGNVTKAASNVLLGRFDLKAAGEPIKVENLRISVTSSNAAPTLFALRNGTIFADGVQVGTATSIKEDNNTSAHYTTFTFGSSLVVTPGKTVVLEVRADIYNDYTGGTAIATGETMTLNIEAGSSNLKKMNSLSYTVNTAVSANSLTVAVGGLSGAVNSAYANQTVITPQTTYKLASFTVTSNETEKVNLDTISLTFTGTNTEVDTGLTDVYVKYGAKTSSVKSTVASTTSWSISEEMASNSSMVVEVYGSMTSSLVDTNTLITALTLSGTSASSATAATTGSVTGQTITVSTGSVSAAAVSDSTLATKMVVGNTSPKVASFRFTATNDTYKVTDIALLAAGGANGAGAIRTLTLKSAGMADKEVWLGAGYEATSSNLAIMVPANDSAGVVVDVYANLNAVGGYAATSSADVSVTLDTFKTVNSVGTVGTTAGNVVTNAQYVFKSVPTITLQTLPSTVLTSGTKTLSKFTVAADSAGAIGWKAIAWSITKTAATEISGTTAATSTLKLYNAAGDVIDGLFATSTIVTTSPECPNLFKNAATTGTLYFVATDEQQITTSETYSLKGTVSGTVLSANINVSIGNPNTTHTTPTTFTAVAGALGAGSGDPSFVWTDRSENSHGVSTHDWNDDYKVKGLPTDTQTMSAGA